MKTLDDIWEEYLDHGSLSSQTLKELAWHIEYDPNPRDAITMATDMGLKALAPSIAKQLEHEDDQIRELSIGCLLGRLELPEYAEKGFKLAQEDPDNGPRDLAIFNLGSVLNKISDKNSQYKIASYLFKKFMSAKTPFEKGSPYRSILSAMGIPVLERPRVRDLGKEIDFDLVERFKKKYGIWALDDFFINNKGVTVNTQENEKDPNKPRLNLHRIYVKNSSFESFAVSLASLQHPIQPTLEMQVFANAYAQENNMHQAVLGLKIGAKNNGDVIWRLQLEEAGFYTLEGFSEEQEKDILNGYCMNQLYSYASVIVTQMVVQGGFSPVYLQPMDFHQLYQERKEELKAGGE